MGRAASHQVAKIDVLDFQSLSTTQRISSEARREVGQRDRSARVDHHAMGSHPVLVEGFQDRLFHDRREGGSRRHQPDIPRGYDSDPLDQRLRERGVEMIAPDWRKRKKTPSCAPQIPFGREPA
jgi:hypothetical protein